MTFSPNIPRPQICAVAFTVLLAFQAVASRADESSTAAQELSGQQIYAAQCASCHGPAGEGVADKHDEPLYGDRSLADLAKVIHETMPEDAEKKCTEEEAQKVAAYIREAFYTAEARARHRPPVIDPARLTVRQYSQVIADLLATSSGEPTIGDERGLKGDYYKSRNTRRNEKVFERIDPRIDFNYGAGSPELEKIGAEEFSMRWDGSLLVDETGEYEFSLKSENGIRLWVNNPDKALIDEWVSSGEVREPIQSLRLLGGRAYPIRVQFFKFKDKSASVVLRWKTPSGVWEVIPARHLIPGSVPRTLVVDTPFPADDSSAGYPRGTSVSKAWDKAATSAAIEVANHVVANIDTLANTRSDAADRRDRVKDFCRRFAERAFRRPLSDEQRQLFVDSQFSESNELDSAVKRSVLLILKSPRFLYPEIHDGAIDDYDVATRLSFALWDSLPDRELLDAASKGELKTRDQVTAHAQRMLANPRAKAKLRDFFHHWLPFDEADDISKDREAYPDFDDAAIADLRTSLERFIDGVVFSEKSDYRELLRADYLLLNHRLAKLYGAEAPDDGEFHRVARDAKERAGVVTHPFLLAALAYHKSSSPIHRGVFATRKLLGRTLMPPPAAIQFMDGDFDPHLTMREKVAELTKSGACQSCHSVINPLGFSLEHYDALGRYRTEDQGRAIDATSVYKSLAGEETRLSGARDLAELAAASPEAHQAFVEQLFQHTVKQPSGAYGNDTAQNLTATFTKDEFNIQKLLVQIAATAAIHDHK